MITGDKGRKAFIPFGLFLKYTESGILIEGGYVYVF